MGTGKDWREHILRVCSTNQKALAMCDLLTCKSLFFKAICVIKEANKHYIKGISRAESEFSFPVGEKVHGHLNFLRLKLRTHYGVNIKQCILCINTFQFTAFPSQREFALITRQSGRKMGRLETEKGVTKPHSLLHNSLCGQAHPCGVPPDGLILITRGTVPKPVLCSILSVS